MTDLMYCDAIQPGHSGYALSESLYAAVARGDVSRGWRLGNRLVSVQLHKSLGGGLWKSRERFELDAPNETLDKLEACGVYHPSSWSDCYHQLAPKTRPVLWTYNGLFMHWPGGPWAQAKRKGTFGGTWYRYDLQGAYRWAATWGLPIPESYRVVRRRGTLPGLWVGVTREDRPDLPPLFQERGATVVASHEEIERYNLSLDVIRGVTWSATHPRDYVEQTLTRLPYPKNAGRAYWGRWIARDPLTCFTATGAEWDLKNIHCHFVWGWLIVGRVRLRVWEVSQEAAHVYVDEVLVPHELPTGGEGEWKLKEMYPDGVTVHRTGHYGAALGSRPTMQTGVKHHV